MVKIDLISELNITEKRADELTDKLVEILSKAPSNEIIKHILSICNTKEEAFFVALSFVYTMKHLNVDIFQSEENE